LQEAGLLYTPTQPQLAVAKEPELSVPGFGVGVGVGGIGGDEAEGEGGGDWGGR